jgi:iron complex outermembrane receptor protein
MRDVTTIAGRTVLLGGILVTAIGLVGYGAPAMAQEPQQEKPVKEVKEEVTVTGTLIPRPTLEAMSPVSTLEVEELTYRGVTRLEDLLTQLPQIFASQNSVISNGSSGVATVNLRNLGEVRTLVLIDGRRSVGGDYNSPGSDLNFIPASLVKRVDILTGGASATYGADAVAGVVNFILDRDFEGLRGGIQFGGYGHDNSNATAARINAESNFAYPKGQAWDGGALSADIAFGGKFGGGKGHASFYANYRTVSAVKKDRRDYTNCAASTPPEIGDTGPYCGGSSTSDTGRFEVYRPDGTKYGSYTLDTSGAGNTWKDRAGYVWNYNPYNYLQRPDKRWTAGGFLNYKWNDHFEGYGEVMFMNDVTDAQIAPSGDFYGSTFQLNVDNPLLSDQQRQILLDAGWGPHDVADVTIGRRSVESGGRVNRLTHNDWRIVAGLKGEISKAWTYDLNGLLAEVSKPEQYGNDFGTIQIQDALIADGDPSDPSTWHCRSGNAGCVPWNIFRRGGVTQDALNYLLVDYMYEANTKTQMITGKINADLTESGWVIPSAVQGIQFALGADYGVFSMYYRPDEIYQTGNASGAGSATPPVSGAYNQKEVFTELLIPIVQGARGAQDLSLELGYRWSDYSTTGGYGTYKAQASWAPSTGLKFRGGFNRATRSPNVGELFTPIGYNLGGASDPCSGATPTATLEQCQRTGVTPAQYGHIDESPAGQYAILTGGNRDLRPEIGDTISYGVVITPPGIPGFTAALDYYRVKVTDVIGTLLADDILDECITHGNLCDLVHRDRFGSLWIVNITTGVENGGYTITTNQNVGGLTSEGVDVNLSYTLPAGNSLFTFNLTGTYLLKNTTDTGMYSYDCVGYYGDKCNNFYGVVYGLTPKWRHLFRASWETGNTVVSLGWRMIDKMKNEAASSDPQLADPALIPTWKLYGNYEIPMTHYFDLAFSYKPFKGVQWTIGVNNVFDKEPPFAAGLDMIDYGPGFYGAYDLYGRYAFSSLQFTF